MGVFKEAGVIPQVSELQRNGAAFEQFVRDMAPVMASSARSVGISHHEVDDVVQDAFIGFTNVLPSLRDDNLRAYVKLAARRHAINAKRKGHIQREKEASMDLMVDSLGNDLPVPEDAAEQVVDKLTRSSAAKTIFESLGIHNRDQQVVFLLRAEGYTDSEIAEMTGVDLDTVRTRAHRGKKFAERSNPGLVLTSQNSRTKLA